MAMRDDQAEVAASMTGQAFLQLRSAILWATLEPGERLKIEKLKKLTGLSSTPVREALTRLAAEGLVELDEGRGFRVTPVSVDEFRDLTRLRVLCECEALAEAIDVGDDGWEADILAAFHRLSAVEASMAPVAPALDPEWSKRHFAFHRALTAACTSPLLKQLCADYFERAERFRRISARWRTVPRNKSAEHGRIMRAALSRQKATALDLMRKHVELTSAQVVTALAKFGSKGN
jgi:GntR family transcriptional regulator, carbon starvation induced regulator